MKKTRYFILFLFTFLLISPKVYATCSQEELNHFKEIEDQYKVTYDYNPDTKTYSITYIMTEVDKYRYEIAIAGEDINCTSPEEGKIVCTGKNFNGYQEFIIIGNSNTCTGEIKKTSLTIPKYNEFYGSQLCEGIEEFALCQLEYDEEITEEEFEKRVEIYKKNQDDKNSNSEKEENNDEKQEDGGKLYTIKQYIKDNFLKIFIITIFVILCIVSITMIVVYERKRRRLE